MKERDVINVYPEGKGGRGLYSFYIKQKHKERNQSHANRIRIGLGQTRT